MTVIRSVSRASQILVHLGEQQESRSAKEIAAALGLALPTAYHLLGTLVPLDLETIVGSVAKTGRLVCVQECPPGGSWGASVVASVVELAWESLDLRPRLVSGDDTPIPYAGSLEDAWLPSVDRIVAELRDVAAE